MKKRSLLIVVALLCMASLMAAMAYSSATVTNAADLTIANTTQSLLKLEAEDLATIGMKDGNAYVSSGNLVFDFDKGKNGQFGLQRNSEYEWFYKGTSKLNSRGLFNVTNNTSEDLKVNIKAIGVPSGIDIYVCRADAAQSWVQIDNEIGFTSDAFDGDPGARYGVKIVVRDDAGLGNTDGMKIVVTGTAWEGYNNN